GLVPRLAKSGHQNKKHLAQLLWTKEKPPAKRVAFYLSNLRSQATSELELVADTNTDKSGLQLRCIVYVLGIGTNSVYIGALGQGVGVTQAVDLLIFHVALIVSIGSFAYITHCPGGHDLTRTDRSADTNCVVISFEAFSYTTKHTYCATSAQEILTIEVALRSKEAMTYLATSQVELGNFKVIATG